MDGVDLTPFLKGEKASPPHDALFFGQQAYGAVLQAPWKLVLASNAKGRVFDLSKDLAESKDLALANDERVKELSGKWNAWHAQMPPMVAKPQGKE